MERKTNRHHTDITYYSNIQTVAFYVLGDEENKLDSTVTIINNQVMKGNIPMQYGIYDSHMGTTDYGWVCSTCYNKKKVCPGHFGSVIARYPVKSPMFRDEIIKWLKVTCHKCGSIVVPFKKGVQPARLLTEMVKVARTITHCPVCGEPHYMTAKDSKSPLKLLRVIKDPQTNMVVYQPIYNNEIKTILSRINPNTLMIMGKPPRSHPSKFILSTIRAPPNTIRPDIKRFGGPRGSNTDMTSLMKALVDFNNSIPQDIPNKITDKLDANYYSLDLTYNALIKGGGEGETKMTSNTNKVMASIASRLPKKTGRIRGNLMGKRVVYMVRSVITGDSNLKIYEVGMPKSHARNLEIPEVVTEKNMDRLKIYYTNGLERYPGCKRIIKKSDGQTYRIEKIAANYDLQVGDTVLRDMITGDWVNFNRQPSLLFTSISGMKVVVMEGDTLRLNPAICNFFNADFDGDQMNVIVPQDIQARNECMHISTCIRWFISLKSQNPSVGAFQDCLIGLAELTKDGLQFNKWHAMKMLSNVESRTVDYDFNDEKITNREIVSRLLPKINITHKSPTLYKQEFAPFIKYNPSDISLNIIRGKLVSGIIDKANAAQDTSDTIFHIIALEYGYTEAMKTIYDFQQLTHTFLLHHGFTTGISDINIPADNIKEIKQNIALMITESRKITDEMNNRKLIPPLGTTVKKFYEERIINALTAGDGFIAPVLKGIDFDSNGIARLIFTGSKGKIPNFISMNGAIGMQLLNGRLFKPQVGWGRTLPFYLRYDTEPEANGYASTSFREGIRSNVYPFVSGEARYGLISNALSTSITGYQNRILIKNLESVFTDNLRKSTKNYNILQVLYADSGINPTRLVKVKFPHVFLSDEEFKKYKADSQTLDKKFRTKEVEALLEQEFEQLKRDRARYREIFLTIESHNPKEYIASNTKFMPFNVHKIIEDTIFNYQEMTDNLKPSDKIIDPVQSLKAINHQIEILPYVYYNENWRQKKRPISPHISTIMELSAILIRAHLCISQIVSKKIYPHLLKFILDKIYVTYQKALIDYGTSVGIMAAQSLSEPLTQYVLNSKHRSGGIGGTQTSTIVRIQEIYGARPSEKMNMPTMLIILKEEYENDKLKVREIANHIEMIRLNKFIKETRIFFEAYGKPTHPKFVHEAAAIAEAEKHNYGQKVPRDLAKWCIRFTFNKEELLIKSMKLETIILAIKKIYGNQLFLIYSPENADELFLRCYIRSNAYYANALSTSTFYETVVYKIMTDLENIVVRGVDGIIAANEIQYIKNTITPDGKVESKKAHCIITNGTNLKEILKNPYIDPYKTQTDSIVDFEEIFGIVAARHKIINELLTTVSDMNRVHITIAADEMTYNGIITSLQRTGLQKRENSNITLRLSFSSPLSVLQSSAINGAKDEISGVSGPLMLGSTPSIGTTYNKIVVNEEFINDITTKVSKALDDL